MTSLRRRKGLQSILELALIVFVGLYAAQDYINSETQKVLIGFESQWLTSSAYISANTLHTQGYLPLWEPWLGHGEPSIDNPFSFVLNPLSTAPSLIAGPENGIKISVILYTIFVGIGGWVLGEVLGLGWLGRLFLALVCIGRGNMHAQLGIGYFQLGVTQAYFPWVTAATLGIIRFKTRRWPVVLLTISLTLLFWAGNIYYTLPALIFVALLTLFFLVKVEKRRLSIDGALLRRVLLALVLTIGLAAASLIPIYAHQQYIGGHPNENPNSVYESPLIAAAQFFTTTRLYSLDTWHQDYFSFVLPFWFALLIFVVLPITMLRLQRSADSQQHSRVYAAGFLMIVGFLIWGTKASPLINWVYTHIPLIGQWRVLSRMLTVSAFWLGVLAAMRVDALWRALVIERRVNRWAASIVKPVSSRLHWLVAAALIVACTLAVKELVESWKNFGYLDFKSPITVECVAYLRQNYPNVNLSVFVNDYYQVAIYIDAQIRFPHINADFHPTGMTPTIYDYDLTTAPPEYLISFNDPERQYWTERGYQFVEDSPKTGDNRPCLMRNPNTLSYAFTIARDVLQVAPNPLPPALTTPIWSLNRQADHIGMIVSGDPTQALVLVVQELAWPGWEVTVDGAPAHLESVGQLIGVVLPPGEIPHQILFVYDPPLLKLGGVITLITAGLCALYLLNGERFIAHLRQVKAEKQDTITH